MAADAERHGDLVREHGALAFVSELHDGLRPGVPRPAAHALAEFIVENGRDREQRLARRDRVAQRRARDVVARDLAEVERVARRQEPRALRAQQVEHARHGA